VARRRSPLRLLALGAAWAVLALFALFIFLVCLYTAVRPGSTLMLARMVEGKSYQRIYAPLKTIAPIALASVVASEDASFCDNDGVDWGSLREVLSGAGKHGPSRGASTITMQTAKNLFLWPGRSTIRKGIEIGMALVMGEAWSKAHTLEIYLNIAEWGDGIYGIEAAAQRYFHKSASPDPAQPRASHVASASARRQPGSKGSRKYRLAQMPAAVALRRAHREGNGRMEKSASSLARRQKTPISRQ
jgi:monofunctional biosynthetic peptidoglycan transglycosylase